MKHENLAIKKLIYPEIKIELYKFQNFIPVPPERDPEIVGLSHHYALGENITANCTAWPSIPQAKIHWTINKEKVIYFLLFEL